ncbi:manganese and iron superoxide dismutase [Neoconidiobolus thromboides FSU 785]|nr:manganese and iron superoxide dismutase [Neoconidiobolus thromboides FSU 785]
MLQRFQLISRKGVKGLAQTLCREKHTLIPISTELQNIKLYPKTQMKYIIKEMEQLTDKLNDITEGTKYESENLYQTMVKSSGQYYDTNIFNYSSQLWNMSFFLQALSPTQIPIKTDLKNRLIANFGSLQGFQSQFMAAAEGVFGNGWVWLVEDARGELKIVNTINSGNPLIPNRLQSIEGVSTEINEQLLSKLPFTLSKDKPTGYYIPILNLNMWQSGYILDHENQVKLYTNQFLNTLDWNIIHQRLFREKY